MSDAPQSDSFAAVADLLALIAQPADCAKRLAELKASLAAIAKAQAKLDTERAEFDRQVAVTKAELAEREERVAKRVLRAVQFEAQHPQVSEEETLEAFPLDPNFGPGTRSHTGLTRARHHE